MAIKSSDNTYASSRKPVSTSGTHKKCLVGAIGFCLYLCLYACAATNYGSLQPSSEITKIFQTNQVLSDHVYYFSGLQGVPDAIIAVHSNYSLRSDMWRQIDFSAVTLKTWVFRMTAIPLNEPQGAWILGPEGNRLGIWYAAQRQTTVRLDQNKRVVVIPPASPDLQRVR